MSRGLVCGVMLLLFGGCSSPVVQHVLSGETMGTYYNIRYLSTDKSVRKQTIDSLLVEINDELSTYIPTSTISMVNDTVGELEIDVSKRFFIENFMLSDDLYQLTGGAFDPTVMPLVNYWGFGYEPKRAVTQVDSQRITDIMDAVGWDKLNFELTPSGLRIDKGHAQLDMSAIAKGYAIDVISEVLDEYRLEDYKIEIGGEVRARGYNVKGTAWLLGVSRPEYMADEGDFVEYVALSNAAMASSGNYRNYHEVNGRKYGHTINPSTGYPEMNDLLAVTVIADDCATADALATACMTLGYERALYLIENLNGVSACFFRGDSGGGVKKTYSDGFIQYVYRPQ